SASSTALCSHRPFPTRRSSDLVETRLGIYFRSVMLQSLIVALASWLGLTIVGLNNALSVGIAIGLANTIPYFGPMIGYILSIVRSEEHTSELQSRFDLVCRLLL